MIRPARRARRQAQGFTLIELMMVIVVIGVLSSLIMPSMSAMLGDTRAANAAEDVIRLHRHVRARTLETGLAHLVQWDGAADGGLGRLTVWEGMNNRCSTTPWGVPLAANAANSGHVPIETLSMAQYNLRDGAAPSAADTVRQVIRLTAKLITGASPTAVTASNLCFQPSGQVYADAAGGTWVFTPQSQHLVFVVTRSIGGVQQGVTREVVYPVGGPARHLQ